MRIDESIQVTGINRRFYRDVSANDSLEDSYVVPSGKTLIVHACGGNSSHSPEVKIQICWYPVECLLVTNGDNTTEVDRVFEGDGSKYMRILLQNDSDESSTIGGWWRGELIG